MQPLTPSTELDANAGAAMRALFRGEAVGDDLPLQAIIEHGMAPLVYEWAPSLAPLRSQALAVVAAEARRGRAVGEMLALLERAGVAAIIVKGTALAYLHYASPALRPRGDTDLLIRRDDLRTIRDVMCAAGFVEAPLAMSEDDTGQTTFAMPDGSGETFDVHWRVANSPAFENVVTYEEVADRLVPIPTLAPSARTLPIVESLLLACVHRVAHHYGSDRLIWLYDIALLRSQMTADEHQRFWRLAAGKKVVNVCRDGIERAHSWFGGDPTHDLPAANEATVRYLAGDRRRLHLEWDDLGALPTWRRRIQRVRERLFPPASYMQARYADAPRAMLPLLYLRRLCGSSTRLFQRLRA